MGKRFIDKARMYEETKDTQNFFLGVFIGFILTVMFFSVFGCVNVAHRFGEDRNRGPYYCTKVALDGIATGFGKSDISSGFEKAVCGVLLPVLIIDLPFDAVVDTVMLPWDTIQQGK